jgi:hypothetical protein
VFSVLLRSCPPRLLALGRTPHVVVVVEPFSDQAANADLAKVIEEGADLLSCSVDLVGVVVEEGEQKLLAPLPVAVFAGPARLAGDVVDSLIDLVRFLDPDLAESFVDGFELAFSAKDDAVELADDVGRVAKLAVVSGWGEEEPDEWQIECQGEREDFLGVELTASIPLVGPFDG